MDKLIKDIKNKIKKNDKNVDFLFDDCLEKLKMVSELDIIKTFEISYTEYERLKNASKTIEITEEQLKEVILILNIIDDKMKVLNLVNDKVIRSGGKISKNAMSYILKKDNEKIPQTAVINVYIDDFGEPLKLNEVIKGGEKDE